MACSLHGETGMQGDRQRMKTENYGQGSSDASSTMEQAQRSPEIHKYPRYKVGRIMSPSCVNDM